MSGSNACSLLVAVLATDCTPILLYATDQADVNNDEFMKIGESFHSKTATQSKWCLYGQVLSHLLDFRRQKLIAQPDNGSDNSCFHVL